MQTLIIKGTLWLENSRGQVIGPGKKNLLDAIHATGSIKSAAKRMKMSYRHAWEMVNSINRSYPKPLIKKAVGGAKGGGTMLTEDGKKLISTYESLFKEFEKFKKKSNKQI